MFHFIKGKPQSHRIKRLQIQASIFLDILRQDGMQLLRCEGIPTDARALAFAFSEDGLNIITVYVESAEFDEIPEGGWPESLDVTFSVCYPEVVEPDKLLFTVGEEGVQRFIARREKEFEAVGRGG